MIGNVSEWCWDWWGYYNSKKVTNPIGPEDEGYFRVLRGGGYQNTGSGFTKEDSAYECRVFRRHMCYADGVYFEMSPGIGFRIVRNSK